MVEQFGLIISRQSDHISEIVNIATSNTEQVFSTAEQTVARESSVLPVPPVVTVSFLLPFSVLIVIHPNHFPAVIINSTSVFEASTMFVVLLRFVVGLAKLKSAS